MTEVIGVRFRGGCKEYYFDPHGIAVEAGIGRFACIIHKLRRHVQLLEL